MLIIGIILIILQCISAIGNAGRISFFQNTNSLWGFINDLAFFIGNHLPAIIGIIFIIVYIVKKVKLMEHPKEEEIEAEITDGENEKDKEE